MTGTDIPKGVYSRHRDGKRRALLHPVGLLFVCVPLMLFGCQGHDATSSTPTPFAESEGVGGVAAFGGQRTVDIDALRLQASTTAAAASPTPTATVQPPRPAVSAFAPAPGGAIWLATSTDDILVSSDGGASWSLRSHLPHVQSLAFPSDARGWAGTDDGLRRSNDGGRTWQPVRFDVSGAVTHLRFIDPNHGWLSINGMLFATNDGGASWASTGHPCSAGRLAAFSFIDQLQGWALCAGASAAGCGDKWLYHTTDGGRLWDLIADATGSLEPIPHQAPGYLPACGYGNDIFFLDALHGWICLTGASALSSTLDGGTTWMTGDERVSGAVQFLSLTRALGISDGQFIESTDGGRTWRTLYAPSP